LWKWQLDNLRLPALYWPAKCAVRLVKDPSQWRIQWGLWPAVVVESERVIREGIGDADSQLPF